MTVSAQPRKGSRANITYNSRPHHCRRPWRRVVYGSMSVQWEPDQYAPPPAALPIVGCLQAAIAVVAGLAAQVAGAHACQPQGLPLAETADPQFTNDLVTRRDGCHLLLSTSRIASTSSIELPRSFFSLEFPASSAFRRCTSDTFMPPNLAFQKQ